MLPALPLIITGPMSHLVPLIRREDI
jgi:hypothetical protein